MRTPTCKRAARQRRSAAAGTLQTLRVNQNHGAKERKHGGDQANEHAVVGVVEERAAKFRITDLPGLHEQKPRRQTQTRAAVAVHR